MTFSRIQQRKFGLRVNLDFFFILLGALGQNLSKKTT